MPALPRIDMQGTTATSRSRTSPGTLHFNQWEGVKVYFDQATKQGATDATAKVLSGRSSRSTGELGSAAMPPPLALARRGARRPTSPPPAARGCRARRRRHHGRRLRRPLDGHPHQAARAVVRRRRARAGHLRRRRERPQRRLRDHLVGQVGTLVELCGPDGALAIARASSRPWTRSARSAPKHAIDAHYHRGGHLWTATRRPSSAPGTA